MKRSMVIALRLAKEGFMNGNPDQILKAPASTVLAMLEYVTFTADYQNAYVEMHRKTE